MSKNVVMDIEKRDISLNARQLRSTGKVPATIYGHGFEPVSVQLDAKTFKGTFKGEKTAIMELQCSCGNHSVIVKNVQYRPTSDDILNIEFQKIKSDEKIRVSVPIVIVGVSPAVKMGGILRPNMDEIEIECFPQDIPASISVDISVLESSEDVIHVRDVKYPEGVAAVSASGNVVVKVIAPKESSKAETAKAGKK